MPKYNYLSLSLIPDYIIQNVKEAQELDRQFIKKKIHDRMRIYGESFEKALNAVDSVTIGKSALFETLRKKGSLKP